MDGSSSARWNGHRAVLFDLGGVVLGSPLHAIARYERERGIPEGFVNRLVAGSPPDGAWHRLERGELVLGDDFYAIFDRECEGAGQPVDSRAMFAAISEESQPRAVMLRSIERLRAEGLVVAALTNNWSTDGSAAGDRGLGGDATHRAELEGYFDHFLESAVLGLRKPDPRIYRVACDTMGVEPGETVFLDDIGANLKSARTLGMTTIKVVEPEAALGELARALGLEALP